MRLRLKRALDATLDQVHSLPHRAQSALGQLRSPKRAISATVLAMLVLSLAVAAVPRVLHAQDSAQRPPAGHSHPNLEGATADPRLNAKGPIQAMIELTGDSSAVAAANAQANGSDPKQAGRDQKQKNKHDQQDLLSHIKGDQLNAKVIYQTQAAYNGIAVTADANTLKQIAGLPGVKAIHPLTPVKPSNANTVPLIGAPQVWESYGKTGAGMKIGIIDTGIDYTHAMFGGPGTSTAFNEAGTTANNPPMAVPCGSIACITVTSGAQQIFPSAKVVGGFDFAGDSYDADPQSATFQPVPHPDPNPRDCAAATSGSEGHGSHVSGTAAGYGVNSNGTTYTGPWNTSTPFDSMRIGPGVAPEASLYGLRVFGCNGSTNLVTQAIDWAIDPNGDGDTSDHLDVINMSLGSDYGPPDDPDSVASDNASKAGVIVVNAAGNASDVFYISGSPASSTRALSVAASNDTTDIVDGFKANGGGLSNVVEPASFSVAYPWASKPDVSGDLVYNVNGNTTGCSAFTADLTGKVVLLDWAPRGTSSFPCGSAGRTNNAAAAGAAGVVMASGQRFFDTSITGGKTIPAVFTTYDVGAALKTAMGTGTVSITFSNSYHNSVKHVLAGNDDTLASFTSRGPANRTSGLKPDITAPGSTIFSTASGTGNQGESLSGTSMATPHMSGVMALLKQAHPDWTVEQLKALAMNTAGADLYTGLNHSGTKYAPARVGAGRVQADVALHSNAIAYVDDGSGAVGVSFGALEVTSKTQVEKKVRVVNNGNSDQTYKLGYDARTTIPGVTYSFPGNGTVTVKAHSQATFMVRLSADASQMHNTHDPTIAATDSFGIGRQWVSEASGIITLTPTSGPTLRVPVYASARPSSQMTATPNAFTFKSATGTASLNLSGQGVSTGDFGPGEYNSLVTPFELQGVSPKVTQTLDPASDSEADLQYVGVTTSPAGPYGPAEIYFGLTTWHDMSTLASENEYDVYIDTNGDNNPDYVLFNTRLSGEDVFLTELVNLSNGSATLQEFTNWFDSSVPTDALNNNVMFMPVDIDALGLSGNTRINYTVYAFTGYELVDAAGPFTYDYAHPGFDFTGGSSGAPTYLDMPGDTVPVSYNQANYNANGSKGILLMHHYNTAGNRAQVIQVTPAHS